MYKPRIKWNFMGSRLGWWKCEGRKICGYGWTPGDAYRDWRSRRIEYRGQCLTSARMKREAKEKRDLQREIRRAQARAQAHAQEKAAKAGEESFNNQLNQRVELKPWWWPF